LSAKTQNSKSVFNYPRVAAQCRLVFGTLGVNSVYFGESHPLSFSSMRFMYNVLCIPPVPETVLCPRTLEPRVWEEITALPGTGLDSLIKFHFVCVRPSKYGHVCGAFATAQDQGAFPFSIQNTSDQAGRELSLRFLFLTWRSVASYSLFPDLSAYSATQFRLIKVSLE
jgi:hypothetical protein